MQDESPNISMYPFRIQKKYIARWVHEFDHGNLSPEQIKAVHTVSQSMERLLAKRDDVQVARGAFFPVSIYPANGPTLAMQKRLYHATEEFFQAFYVAVVDLSSLVKRISQVFGAPPSNSVAKFIKWWGASNYSFFMETEATVLESARAFRAMLDHRADRPTYVWHTGNFDGFVRILLLGQLGNSGKLPEGAVTHPEGWAFLAPDEDRVTTALAVQLSAVAQTAMAHLGDRGKAMQCTWEHPYYEEDTHDLYPVFSAIAGEVQGVYKQTVEKRVKIDPIGDSPSA